MHINTIHAYIVFKNIYKMDFVFSIQMHFSHVFSI